MATARISADIGGTFTDVVLVSDTVHAAKISSTPAHPERAVIEGVRAVIAEAGLDPADVTEVLHGTTIGSNTLLQKSGARCGLITTCGFRDVLEIGRVRTPGMFDLSWDKPEPLIARRHRIEVDERVAADGSILRDVDLEAVAQAGAFLAGEGIEAVAICFLNSYRNPANEAAAASKLMALHPEMAVSASIHVLPEMREYERTSTVAVNAYVLPALRDYLERLAAGLKTMGINAPLLVANSAGGLSRATHAQRSPVFFVSSGRSAGVVGAAALGATIGEKNIVAFDMGGTTASASLVRDGELSRTSEYEFRAGISTPSRFIKAGGYLMRVPSIDVAEVGSGAGSIAAIDRGGLLEVGPRSAGAVPGPACYGMGGERSTVTDANLVLGYLPPSLAGGALALKREAAADAIRRDLAEPLGVSVEDAADGVRRVANSNMARTIRVVTIERGLDPRDFTLVAFGGSGPAHACDLAEVLGIRRIVFPNSPGLFTAVGMLAASIERYFLRPILMPLDRLNEQVAGSVVAALRDDALAAFREDGIAADRVDLVFAADLRFVGQDSELPIRYAEDVAGNPVEALREAFLAAYRDTYGYASSDGIEVVNMRLRAKASAGRRSRFEAPGSAAPLTTPQRTRQVYFGRRTGWIETPVFARGEFRTDAAGPIIIESSDSTVVVGPGARASVDALGNIICELGGA